MLSVLIPLMNLNPIGLAESLAGQLLECGKPFEILISDDSAEAGSSIIAPLVEKIPGVRYFKRDTPLGRSANRNFLAREAQYEFLLFIDGDAGMANDNFIKNYLCNLSHDTVLCGGTLYQHQPPENIEFMLRWKYGRQREQTDAKSRQKRPWASFSTFNFLIPAEVFKNICFDETVNGYGHEDTMFGINLHKRGINILHLNNGLFHLGLESAMSYLAKMQESCANLRNLEARNSFTQEHAKDLSLLITWKRLRKYDLDGLAATWFKYRRKSIEKRLCGPRPSMLLLDLYKLGSISSID